MEILPVGKLPPEIADRIVKLAPILDSRIIVGPRTGMDCAVIDLGTNYLVVKTDPITFATENIGWYAVQVNLNDIVTTGATPKWMVATILLPENKTNEHLVNNIAAQLFAACQEFGISFVGGHTEITHNLDRPIISATLLGEVNKDDFISPDFIQTGDDVILIKDLAIETTAILAYELESELATFLSDAEVIEAKQYLFDPGISVYKPAQMALAFGGVHAMHDPTEGGLAGALCEFSIAANKSIHFDPKIDQISPLSKKICDHFNIDPLQTISSGALIAAVDPTFTNAMIEYLNSAEIKCSLIGKFEDDGSEVYFTTPAGKQLLKRPDRDAISDLFSG